MKLLEYKTNDETCDFKNFGRFILIFGKTNTIM